MDNKHYFVFGAGESKRNPVQVSVGCETAVTVCWIGKICEPNGCLGDVCASDIYCQLIGVTESCINTPCAFGWQAPNGEYVTVWYVINKDCPTPNIDTCETNCSDLELSTVPSYVDKSYNDM